MKKLSKQSFPSLRMRRLRSTDNIRRLVRETKLAPENLIQPIFLSEGKNKKEKYKVDKVKFKKIFYKNFNYFYATMYSSKSHSTCAT